MCGAIRPGRCEGGNLATVCNLYVSEELLTPAGFLVPPS